MKSHYYWKTIDVHKRRLRDAIPIPELKELHRHDPRLHHLYAARQFAIVALCSAAMWRLQNPLYWLPLCVLQGLTFFNMTTLLHEVVHNSVFQRPKPAWERLLG